MPVSLLPALAVVTSVNFLAFSAHAQAQSMPACGNTLVAGQRIECSEQATSTDDIEVGPPGITITTTEVQEHGISGQQSGAGTFRTEFRVDTITTGGKLSLGILAPHTGSRGDVSLRVLSTGTRTNRSGEGADAHAIRGESIASGRLGVVLRGGSIATRDNGSHGIFLRNHHPSSGPVGPLSVDIGGVFRSRPRPTAPTGFAPVELKVHALCC